MVQFGKQAISWFEVCMGRLTRSRAALGIWPSYHAAVHAAYPCCASFSMLCALGALEFVMFASIGHARAAGRVQLLSGGSGARACDGVEGKSLGWNFTIVFFAVLS
jgi:hypothetical protein